jgi:hypothetical protein
MNRGRVGEGRGGMEMDRCPLTSGGELLLLINNSGTSFIP